MKAIVVFYSGRTMDVAHAEMLIGAISPLLDEGYSQPVIKTFSEDDLAKELLKTCNPPSQSTEDGDASVKVVMGFIPVTILENRIATVIALTKAMAFCEHKNDETSKAFMRAMSFLYQGSPVSKKIAKEYHYTKMISDVIKEVYSNYVNQ